MLCVRCQILLPSDLLWLSLLSSSRQFYDTPYWPRLPTPKNHINSKLRAKPAAAPGIRNRMALRPDAARIPRKRMVKFLTPSGRGPGPGLRGTADEYSPDIARTSTLRLRLRLCHKYNNLKSSFQMYIIQKLRNTLRRQSRSFWSKLQHGTNAAWNAFMFTEIHIINFCYPWTSECAEVYHKVPVNASARKQCCLIRMQYDPFKNNS